MQQYLVVATVCEISTPYLLHISAALSRNLLRETVSTMCDEFVYVLLLELLSQILWEFWTLHAHHTVDHKKLKIVFGVIYLFCITHPN